MPFDPLDINGLTYDGTELRRAALLGVMAAGTALSARSGIRPGDPGLAVTLSGTTINVSAGAAWIYQSGQGVYRAVMAAANAANTLTAAHATLTRIDLVYLRVWDTSVDSSGLNQADVVYLAGTPSGTPTAPTPAGTQIYVPLATITVPPVGGGSASVSSAVRQNTVAPGGILPSATPPGSPYVGQFYDNGSDLLRYNGSGWDTYAKVTSVGWTDLIPASGFTTPQGQLQKAQARLRLVDGTQRVELRGSFACTTDVTAQTTVCTMPAAMWPTTSLRTVNVTRNYSSSTSGTTRIEISKTTGALSVFGSPSPAQTSWFCMDNAYYDL